MQADCSVAVSELAVVVLVLALSLANVAHGDLMVVHVYSTQSTHSPLRLPTTTNVPKCYENDSRD